MEAPPEAPMRAYRGGLGAVPTNVVRIPAAQLPARQAANIAAAQRAALAKGGKAAQPWMTYLAFGGAALLGWMLLGRKKRRRR